MSPPRGLLPLLRSFSRSQPMTHSLIRSRTMSTLSSLLEKPFQIYLSRSACPYTNLSLEHHLFQASPEDSVVLLLYTNNPSIIIGRNQNPWVEANLPLLYREDGRKVNLVRRRSGGGTVFHDLGNLNYTVIMPSAQFHRDKHAEMVVRVLRGLGVKEAIVNKRHDIVLLPSGMEAESTRMEGETPEGTRKVSGSAFKLTSKRSYHHGTMLLNASLGDARDFLMSPAKGWMKARGVGSVRSPMANVERKRGDFINALMVEFGKMYVGADRVRIVYSMISRTEKPSEKLDIGVCYVRPKELKFQTIMDGIDELKSPEWTYGQTPELEFSVPPPESSGIIKGVQRPPNDSEFTIIANKGIIESVSPGTVPALDGLVGKIFDGGVINDHIANSKHAHATGAVGSWIEGVLGRTGWGMR